jgi:hypothetical protein
MTIWSVIDLLFNNALSMQEYNFKYNGKMLMNAKYEIIWE